MLFKITYPTQRSSFSQTRKYKKNFFWSLPLAALTLWFIYYEVASYLVEPEAVLVLGGHEDRERFAAKLAKQYPNLPIWISSGSPKEYVEKIFTKAGVDRDRLHLDYQAIDTVTNFTTLVEKLKAQGIDSVYLITSDNHMLRARLVGEIIFGSRGIFLKPISVSSDYPPESIAKAMRDSARAILWLATGNTGRTLISHWAREHSHMQIE